MLTERQMQWAATHDWFVRREGNTIIVADRWYNSATKERGEIIMPWLLSFSELRAWAGY